jgi:hypothetical protein
VIAAVERGALAVSPAAAIAALPAAQQPAALARHLGPSRTRRRQAAERSDPVVESGIEIGDADRAAPEDEPQTRPATETSRPGPACPEARDATPSTRELAGSEVIPDPAAFDIDPVPSASGAPVLPLSLPTWPGVPDTGDQAALDQVHAGFQAALITVDGQLRAVGADPCRCGRLWNILQSYRRNLADLLMASTPRSWVSCTRCAGTGIAAELAPCRSCSGTGRVVPEDP